MILFWSIISGMTLLALGFILWPWIKAFSYITYVIAGSFLLLVIVAWWQWGNQKQITQWLEIKNNTVAVNKLKEQLGNSPEKVIERLKSQLEKNPNSAQGWFLLGKLYLSQKDSANAVAMFKKANQLKPNDPDIMIDYAQALFVTKETDHAIELAKTILSREPKNPRAINLLGSYAFQEGDYQTAINQWEKLRSYYPVGSEDVQALEAAIERAKAGLNGTVKIPVHVVLAAALKSQTSPNDTLFIYARDADSDSKMPLLIMRRQVSDLPTHVILDESMKMNPANSLSQIQKVVIVARISKTGQAKSQAGDLEGKSDVVALHKLPKDLSILINRIVQ